MKNLVSKGLKLKFQDSVNDVGLHDSLEYYGVLYQANAAVKVSRNGVEVLTRATRQNHHHVKRVIINTYFSLV